MAMAGIDLWRVQIFGRWGSAAVLKYVRDAPVGAHANLSLMTARGLDLESLQQEAERSVGGALTPEQVRMVLKATLEEHQSEYGKQHQDLAQELHALRELVAMKARPQVSEFNVEEERWVENHKSQIVHAIKSGTHTYCGWPYSISKAAILRTDTDAADSLCATCVKTRGLLL